LDSNFQESVPSPLDCSTRRQDRQRGSLAPEVSHLFARAGRQEHFRVL